jgi:hypothetical protein
MYRDGQPNGNGFSEPFLHGDDLGILGRFTALLVSS